MFGEIKRYPVHLNILRKFLKLDLRINTFRLGQMMFIKFKMYKLPYILFEFYLTFPPMKLGTVFCHFRCRNHKLPVETGIYKNIPRSERVRVKCTQTEIGDEFHYIFNCPFLAYC